MLNVDDLAAALIAEVGSMTSWKLQKLVYYCQAWHLVRHEKPLFEDEIQAWKNGPVVFNLYRTHRRRFDVGSWPKGDEARLAEDERDTVAWVVSLYGATDGVSLSRMTHAEAPWRTARVGLPDSALSNVPISVDLMRSYYSRQRLDSEAALRHAVGNAAVEGYEIDAEWQDCLRDVAAGRLTIEELVAEEVARARAE